MADDGIAFDAKTVKPAEIRKESNCEGERVTHNSTGLSVASRVNLLKQGYKRG